MATDYIGLFCRGRFLQVVLFKTIYFELNLFAGWWSNLLTVYYVSISLALTTVCIDIDLTQASHLVINKLQYM